MKFCALFESGLKLAAHDLSDGRASSEDLRKTLKTPGTQTLISTILIFLQNYSSNFLAELSAIAFELMNKDAKERVTVDEVVRFVQNISAEE